LQEYSTEQYKLCSQAIHIAANHQVMGAAFATRTWLNVFCSLVALAVASVNGYFLVTFRQEHLPGGAGEMREAHMAMQR
jgi:hypothetical protein